MFYGSNATALALANSVILIEVLKQMPRTKALALIDHAAEVLETDAGPEQRGGTRGGQDSTPRMDQGDLNFSAPRHEPRIDAIVLDCNASPRSRKRPAVGPRANAVYAPVRTAVSLKWNKVLMEMNEGVRLRPGALLLIPSFFLREHAWSGARFGERRLPFDKV
jgi:hypothetical protein